MVAARARVSLGRVLVLSLWCVVATAKKKPHVVFLMCDSMDGRVVDPTSPVSRRVSTPTFDALAKEGTWSRRSVYQVSSEAGVNFVGTYTPSPQCVPGRVAMLTSLRVDQTRAFNNGNGLAAAPDGTLDAACVEFYAEAQCRRWRDLQRVNASMFDLVADFADVVVFGKIDLGGNAQTSGPTLVTVTRAADVRRATKNDPTSTRMLDEKDDKVHPEDWLTIDACVDWVKRRGSSSSTGEEKETNFFLHCSLDIPHPPFETNGTWLGSVDAAAVDLPVWSEPGALGRDGTSSNMHPFLSYQSATKAMSRVFTDAEVRAVRATYYAMCAETDYLMGRVVAELRRTGLWETSYVAFASDHGEMNMEHRQVWKNSMFEASARVPLVISGGAVPAAARGRTVPDLVTILDLLPTFLDWLHTAGGGDDGDYDPRRPKEGVDLAGYSLAPYVAGDGEDDDDDVALDQELRRRLRRINVIKARHEKTLSSPPSPSSSETKANQNTTARPSFVVSQYHSNMANTGAFMVRSGEWKLVRYGTKVFDYFADYAPQLFNLRTDPDELNDVAAHHPDVVDDLETLLRTELATGSNRISATGDPDEVDAYVQREQMQIYRNFFLSNASFLQRALHESLARAARRGGRWGRWGPEMPQGKNACDDDDIVNVNVNDDDGPSSPRPASAATASSSPCSPKKNLLPTTVVDHNTNVPRDGDHLRQLFESEYTDFDDEDMAKVDHWLTYDL